MKQNENRKRNLEIILNTLLVPIAIDEFDLLHETKLNLAFGILLPFVTSVI